MSSNRLTFFLQLDRFDTKEFLKEGNEMKYHNITHDDMLNGEGLRVVLWLSGCEHLCDGCQNSFTYVYEDGLAFDDDAKNEIFNSLKKDYIDGITFSGGDPLFTKNRAPLIELMNEIKQKFPKKTIWLYTGYTFEQIIEQHILSEDINLIDVIVDGKFEKSLADNSYHWAGSTNQRIIDVQKTLLKGSIVLHENN